MKDKLISLFSFHRRPPSLKMEDVFFGLHLLRKDAIDTNGLGNLHYINYGR